jgi:hypothetical protein
MKKYLKSVLLFTILLYGIAFVLNAVIDKNLRKSHMRILEVWNEIYDGGTHYDVLLMGNSRAYTLYNPRILDSVLHVNSLDLGVSGGPIEPQYLKFRVYCNHNTNPKLIIQNIDILTLAGFGSMEKEQYIPYLSDDTIFGTVSHYLGYTFFDRYVPMYKYCGHREFVMEGLGLTHLANTLYKGYFEVNQPWNGSCDGHRLDTLKYVDYKKDPVALKVFDDYLKACKQKHIKIIFVYAPMYEGLTKKIKDLGRMFAMYDSYARKYHIKILNYTWMPSVTRDTTYFWDALHLNGKGAKVFSTQLAHDLDSMKVL